MSKVSLVKEVGRALDASDEAILCAMSWGIVTVDGVVVRPEDDLRWSRSQLAGRMARLHSREGRLFGSRRSAQLESRREAA